MFGYRDDYVFSDDHYEFDWLVDDLDPVRKRFIDPDEDKSKSISNVLLQVARAVENGGRDAMKYAIDKFEVEEDDPDFPDDLERPKRPKQTRQSTRAIKGWARVPTGAETCGWCLMLCSRGPVYHSAYSAGAQLEDYLALQDYDAGQGLSRDDMDEWHPGCDCKVVPVFDTRSWPGKETADEALELWKEATRLAEIELEKNPDKKSFVKGKWIPTTLNREAINQMRRLVQK